MGLPDEVAGDSELADQALEVVGTTPLAALAVAQVSSTRVRVATIGAPLGGTFEIGSIAKGLTGLLYVDALDRGDIGPETTLGDVFNLGDADAAPIRLADIATHRSGLPRLPVSLGFYARSFWSVLAAKNPYTLSYEDLLENARLTAVDAEPQPVYSNFGFALLGHAVAKAAGTTYATLLSERIAEPLGLSALRVVSSAAELGPDAVQGYSVNGRKQQAWTGEAFGPAGTIRSSINDMARLAQSILAGEAPGVRSLDAVSDFDPGSRIGAGWVTSTFQERSVVWHNGGTGGFRSFFGFDRSADRAVALLGATTADLDNAAVQLLTGQN